MFRIFICLILNVWLSVHVCWAQQTHIKLEQGDLIGVNMNELVKRLQQIKFVLRFQLKVFPDGARSAVYAFLGIPYAQPPLGSLRFAVS